MNLSLTQGAGFGDDSARACKAPVQRLLVVAQAGNYKLLAVVVTGATGWGAAVRVRVGGRGWLGGCAMGSTHTRIIDRLKPTGDWKIVVEGVSSGLRVSRSA